VTAPVRWTGAVASLMDLFASVTAEQLLAGGLQSYLRGAGVPNDPPPN